MNGFGYEFFTCSTLSGNEHRALSGANGFNRLKEFFHLGAGANNIVDGILLSKLPFQKTVFLSKTRELKWLGNRDFDLLHKIFVILKNIIHSTHFESLDGIFGGGVGGYHNNQGFRISRFNVL